MKQMSNAAENMRKEAEKASADYEKSLKQKSHAEESLKKAEKASADFEKNFKKSSKTEQQLAKAAQKAADSKTKQILKKSQQPIVWKDTKASLLEDESALPGTEAGLIETDAPG